MTCAYCGMQANCPDIEHYLICPEAPDYVADWSKAELRAGPAVLVDWLKPTPAEPDAAEPEPQKEEPAA